MTNEPRFAPLITRLREFGLNYDHIGALVRVDGRQVQRWLIGENEPRLTYRENLLALDTIVTLLLDHWTPDEAMIWLLRPHERLAGEKSPYRMLERERYRAVLAAARQDVLKVDGISA